MCVFKNIQITVESFVYNSNHFIVIIYKSCMTYDNKLFIHSFIHYCINKIQKPPSKVYSSRTIWLDFRPINFFQIIFFMLVLLRRTSFLGTPSKSYISVIIIHYNFKFPWDLWRQLCTVFLSYDLWVLQGFCLLLWVESHTWLVRHPVKFVHHGEWANILKSCYIGL